jgi:radical SAM superfamily enzyme YgiQ (UPF0313 family)
VRILLVWPNSKNEVLGWGDLGAVAEPLSLEYLGAGVKLDGHEARILDLRLHPAELVPTLLEFLPDVVGVTAFSMHVRTALAICEVVKATVPRTCTVAGGHHATFLPEDFFESYVDFVVTGEGVASLRAILRLLGGDDDALRGVTNVWQRTAGKTFVHTAAGSGGGARSTVLPILQAGSDPEGIVLDSLPPPDRSLTQRDRSRYFIDWMKPVALIRTTVGCPYRCTFCSLWKMMDGHYYMRSIDKVVEEMHGIGEPFVFLVDDEAFINGRRMAELARALARAGLRKRYFAYCRIDTILRRREVLQLWKEIGLERLFVGIDEISDSQLKAFNKHCDLAQIEAGLRTARDLGIEVFAQFVVNPAYTRQDFQRLVRFVEHHKLHYPSFTVLTPIPGTDMLQTFDHVMEKQPNGRPNWDLFDCQNAVTRTALPRDEFRTEYRSLFRVFKGSYTQYREHNFLVDRRIHDRNNGALEAKQGNAAYQTAAREY